MIGFKKAVAALRSAVSKTPPEQQTVGRSLQGSGILNYNTVTTLDPARLAHAFSMADTGYIFEQAKFFELIEERDPHIYAELNKRRLAVTGLPWLLQPPRDATQSELDRTAELTDMVSSISNIEDAQFDMTDAIGKGISMLELEWRSGDTWLPEKINFVPQRLFQTNRDTQELMYLNRGIPEPLRPFGWLVHEHRAKSGYIEQSALFRVLAWTYAYKAYSIKDMQRFLEVYGLPLRLGKHPAGIGDKQRNELLRAVRGIGNDGAGIIPSTMTIDFIQSQPGKVDDFLNAVAYWENKQSMAILGGDLQGKTSSEARIMLYDQVRTEIKLHDVKQLNPSYTQGLLKPIALINGLFPENRMPTWSYNTEAAADQTAVVDVLTKAATLGMEIDLDWAHQELQIPRAKKGADILAIGSTKPVSAALRAALAKVPTQQNETLADAYVRQLTAVAMPYEQAQLEQIAALVAEAGDFESALAAITDLNLKPLDAKFINTLTEALMAANLAGRVEAN